MRPVRTTLLLSIAALFVSVEGASAQRDNGLGYTCDKAAKIVAKGHPTKKDQWALAPF